MKNVRTLRTVAVAAAWSLAATAFGNPPATPQKQVAPATAAKPASHARAAPFSTARVLSDSTLQHIAGRADVSQVVVARNTSTVANNSVGDHNTTGTITFDGQSFEGLHGLSVLSANTGNNVSINASMNVNVAIHQ